MSKVIEADKKYLVDISIHVNIVKEKFSSRAVYTL